MKPFERRSPRSVATRLRGTAAVVAACALTVAVSAQPGDRTQTEQLSQRAGDRLRALQQEADQLASQEKTLLGELRGLELERQIKIAELRQLDAEVAQAERETTETTTRLERLRQEDAATRPALDARLVEMYKMGQARYLRLLFSVTDADRLADASRAVAALAWLDRQRVESHRQTLNDLDAARTALEERRARLQSLRAETLRASEAAAKSADSRNRLVREIDTRRDLNAQLAGELQAAQRKLQATLRALPSGAEAPGGASAATLPLKPFRGALPWPVSGTVIRRFGRPQAAGRLTSNGVEIGAAEGTAVSAVHDGTVAFSGPFNGFGNLVIVDHGAQSFSLYADLLDLGVTTGARVAAGQTVGTVGSAATGTAGLYFELRVDGQPVDPLQWLEKK